MREAIKRGYEILDIEWSVIWDDHQNPFKKIIPELYRKRYEYDKGSVEYYFYKEMMNRCFGKLAEYKTKREYMIEDMELSVSLQEEGYEPIKAIGMSNLYLKEVKPEKKRFYSPIIPTLINAYARVHMYKEMKKVPKEDLIYTDTDSIIFKGEHFDKFEISKKLGSFKIEMYDVPIFIYGNKTS